jgi:DNA invertase Pin-like site-specific DNA recombinase
MTSTSRVFAALFVQPVAPERTQRVRNRGWVRVRPLAMLGVAAKLERRRIKERTARGRADAKVNGVKFGRKPKLTPHQRREAIKRRDKDGETLRSIGRGYNVSAATISRLTP